MCAKNSKLKEEKCPFWNLQRKINPYILL